MAEDTVAPTNGAVPPVEGTPPPAPPAAPDPRLAERFATLARREKALVQKQEEIRFKLEAEKAAVQTERAAVEQARKEAQELTGKAALARDNPVEYFKSLYGDGWYDQLTQYKLSQEKEVPPDMQVASVREQIMSEVQKLKDEQEKFRQEQLQAQEKYLTEEKARVERDNAAQMARFEKDAVDFVKGNAAKYELTTLFGREDLIPQTIKAAYEATAKTGQPRVMSYAEAADEVEKYLLETANSYETWKAKKVAPAPKLGEPPPPPTGSSAPSLSNSLTAPSNPNPAPRRIPTDKERMERALAAWSKAETRRP